MSDTDDLKASAQQWREEAIAELKYTATVKSESAHTAAYAIASTLDDCADALERLSAKQPIPQEDLPEAAAKVLRENAWELMDGQPLKAEQPTCSTCTWTIDDWGCDSEIETSCGRAFEFNDGGPAENGFKFCGYCGGKLIEAYTSAEHEPKPAEAQS